MKQETLGQVFKRYRQAEGVSLVKVEKDLKISQRMLNAIENDDYETLPDELYTKNIIKTYAKYLSLDYNRLMVLYEKFNNKTEAEDHNTRSQKVRVYLTPHRVRNIIIILVIIFLLVYLGLQINQIFSPPHLEIYQPAQDLITQETYIDIKGSTDKEARVFINEKEVFLDPEGAFFATLDLQKGINYIKISSIKKHSRENAVYREILVE